MAKWWLLSLAAGFLIELYVMGGIYGDVTAQTGPPHLWRPSFRTSGRSARNNLRPGYAIDPAAGHRFARYAAGLLLALLLPPEPVNRRGARLMSRLRLHGPAQDYAVTFETNVTVRYGRSVVTPDAGKSFNRLAPHQHI